MDIKNLMFDWCLSQFIGEETAAACGATELTDEPTWIVDPLDGTTNFVHEYISFFYSFWMIDFLFFNQ